MATGTAPAEGELRQISIEGLLPKGKYVTEESYTAAQEDEMRYIATLSAQAVLRQIDPKLIDRFEIEKVA